MDLMVECIGHEGKQIALRQVLPLTANTPASTFITPSNHYNLQKDCVILQSGRVITLLRKISKKAIYLSWLREGFEGASGIFGNILELL
jgi:hypothetical protein